MSEIEHTTFLSGANAGFIAELYCRYLDDPGSVDPSWQRFFAEIGDDRGALSAERAGAPWARPLPPLPNGGAAVQTAAKAAAVAAEGIEADLFVNVQGDEPFTRRNPLVGLLRAFEGPAGEGVRVASLMQELKEPALVLDPNYVKVAVDRAYNALFFSRSPLPYLRDPEVRPTYWEHIGVYAFRREALLAFPRLEAGPLERAEKVECLRFLEHGIGIRMVPTEYMGIEIDTPEDLVRAERLLRERDSGG